MQFANKILLKYLLENGCVNSKRIIYDDGKTLMHYIACDYELLSYLIEECKINIFIKDINEMEPIHMIIDKNVQLINEIIPHFDRYKKIFIYIINLLRELYNARHEKNAINILLENTISDDFFIVE